VTIATSGKVFVEGSNEHTGTAWRCAPGMALTAAHCVVNRRTGAPLGERVWVEFDGAERIEVTAKPDCPLDVALLTFQGSRKIPGYIRMKECEHFDSSLGPDTQLHWGARGFSIAQQDLPRGGHIDGHVLVSSDLDAEHLPVMVLHCNQGGYLPAMVSDPVTGVPRLALDDPTTRALKKGSGAAIIVDGHAVGVLRSGRLNGTIVHATPVTAVIKAFPVLGAYYRSPLQTAHDWLGIDRAPQWDKYAGAATQRVDKTLLLYGYHDEGPDLFCDRILRLLPEWNVVQVRWSQSGQSWPSTKADFVSALLDALPGGSSFRDDATEDTLPKEIVRRVKAKAPLVVVLPKFDLDQRAGSEDDIVNCVGKWLPAILRRAQELRDDAVGPIGFVSLLPVAWTRRFDWVPLLRPGIRRINSIIEQISNADGGLSLSIERLEELSPITRKHLEEFVRDRRGNHPALVVNIETAMLKRRSRDILLYVGEKMQPIEAEK